MPKCINVLCAVKPHFVKTRNDNYSPAHIEMCKKSNYEIPKI